ncbi:MAG: nicotinate dehydrogenase subunit [Alphaproteobacteria bacterium]|jgi:CO/xanthine dehydrogenase Mo-binding subunit|nr:nicotinate dehydrogenase subunit [Alphaproteobacteria bacterium]
MNAPSLGKFSRRKMLAGGGALIVSFALSDQRLFAQEAEEGGGRSGPKLPGSLQNSPMLDSWIRIEADGSVTLFTGKAELGQGIKTALVQLAAEELYLEPHSIKVVSSDTEQTADEGYTAGSRSIQDSGNAVRNAAAQVREILINVAAAKLKVDASQLKAENGKIVAGNGRGFGYGELVANNVLHVNAEPKSKLKDFKTYTLVGQSMPRIDIPGKVTGAATYVQDIRLPGMVHARVVRPPSMGARLRSLDAAQVEKMPGVLKVVRNGSYLAVIAEREFQAIQAMRALATAAQWDEQAKLTDYPGVYDMLQKGPSEELVIFDTKTQPAPGARTVEATYRRPYQMHAAIGPSCAVGLLQDGKLTVWTHNQGVYPLRKAVAELLHMPEDKVRCIHMEGSGCYGHNGSDDAGGDAAPLAAAMPGKPVRVQWMREDEHAWEPYGSAMVTKARASLDAGGTIVDWQYGVWSMSHGTRPGGARSLIAGWLIEPPLSLPPSRLPGTNEAEGNRNSKPAYKLPSARVVHHHIKAMPIRTSALRSLGAYMNVFSVESLMDELATAAGSDPVEFRLRYLDDPRALDVIRLAAERFGWSKEKLPQGRGQGFAYARYKNSATYVALATEVEVARDTGAIKVLRVVAATDSGQAVNPDGIRNQIEGGILQSASWTLYESVGFDKTRIISRDWRSYPILRFAAVPETVEVHVIDRPGQPFLGAGEASQGPMAAAIANAVTDATGARIRDLPLTPDRVKAALGV